MTSTGEGLKACSAAGLPQNHGLDTGNIAQEPLKLLVQFFSARVLRPINELPIGHFWNGNAKDHQVFCVESGVSTPQLRKLSTSSTPKISRTSEKTNSLTINICPSRRLLVPAEEPRPSTFKASCGPLLDARSSGTKPKTRLASS